MAIIYNQGGTKQDERVQFRQLTGMNKAKLAMLGYNASGEMNTFGKVVGAISPGQALAMRNSAKNMVGKNSDVGRQIKSTDKEFIQQKVAQVDFAAEAAKTVIGVVGAGGAGGGTGGGGAGGSMSSLMSGGGGAGGAETLDMTEAANLTGNGGGGDMSSLMQGGGGDMSSMMSNGPSDGGAALDLPSNATGAGFGSTGFDGADSLNQSNAPTADPYTGALTDSDAGKTLADMKEQSDIENTKDEIEKSEKKKETQQKKNEKLNKVLESAPALISKGAKLYQTSKGYLDAEDANLKEAQGRKTRAQYGNFL